MSQQRNKKKITASFYTDEESLNYSLSRRQPKKTVVIDDHSGNNLRYQQTKSNYRYRAPTSYEKSSTPNKAFNNNQSSSKISFNPKVQVNGSYQDSSSISDDSFDNAPLSKVVANDLIKTKEKLIKSEKDLVQLQQKYEELLQKLSDKQANIDSLSKINNTLNQKIVELETKLSVQSKETNKTELELSSKSKLALKPKNQNEPAIGCLLCINKILKNFVGFSIHFSKMHKNYSYEEREQFSYQVKQPLSPETPKNNQFPQTPKPPKNF